MKIFRWFILGIPILVFGWAGLRMVQLNIAEKQARSYPQLAMYSSVHGNGSPYMKDSLGTMVLDWDVLRSQARWDYVTLDITGWKTIKPIIEALKLLNPRIKIYGFMLGDFWWANAQPDTFPGYEFPWHYWQAIRNTNGILYDTTGAVHGNLCNVNLASRRTMEALADTVIAEAIRPGIFDGLFIDVNCMSVAFGSAIDYRRAGFPTLAAFDSSWRASHARFVDRIRANAKPGFMLMGNCGPTAEPDHWNGWMHENWPLQNGGSWESNMLGPNGYLAQDSTFVQPSLNWISAMPHSLDENDPENKRIVRFGLGSACLGGGVFTFPWTPTDHLRGYTPMWFPEYDGNGRGKDWLGQPLGRAYQTQGSLWRRDFTQGAVIVNPTIKIHGLLDLWEDGYTTLQGDTLAIVPPMDAMFLVKPK